MQQNKVHPMKKLFLAALILMNAQSVYSSGDSSDNDEDEPTAQKLSNKIIKAPVVSESRQTTLADYLRAHHLDLKVDPQLVQGWQDDGTLVANFKTLYTVRARGTYHNWINKSPFQKYGTPTLPDQLTLEQTVRLNGLPLFPPKGLDVFGRLKHITLALDDYELSDIFFVVFPQDYCQGLLGGSKTLKSIYFKGNAPGIPLQKIFKGLGTSQVIELTFKGVPLSPEDILYLCNATPPSWREGVKEIDISTSLERFTSEMLLAFLSGFPNLEIFKSVLSFNLTDSPVVFPYMPNLTELSFSHDDVNAPFLWNFAVALKEGKFPKLKELSIWNTDALGDDALPSVLEIIEKHPKVELNLFNNTGFSEAALRQVVEALTQQNYPWRFSIGIEPKYIRPYNANWRKS